MIRKHSIQSFISCFSVFVLALTSFSSDAQTSLPKIIHPSPEVSSLFSFLDYPMDYSTGLPDITIPIYDIKSGSIEVPINIMYHASGCKVSDQDGPIGLGWSLQAGGAISRTIYGSPDFGVAIDGTYKYPFPFKVENVNNQDDIAYLEKIFLYRDGSCSVTPFNDSEYDIFSYSFGNHNGKFVFKDSNSFKAPALFPYKPYVITPFYTAYGLDSLSILDDKGVLYIFGAHEQFGPSNKYANSGWMLTRIISANKADTVTFKYLSFGQYRKTISQSGDLVDNWQIPNETAPPISVNYTEQTNSDSYSIQRVSEIYFNQGSVKFNMASGLSLVDNMQIRDRQNRVLKTIQFKRSDCYSEAELSNDTHRLDSVVFLGVDNSKIERYSFEYFPVITSNGQVNARHCDWWGYYNSSGQNVMIPLYNSVPYTTPTNYGTTTVGEALTNRLPSLGAMESGVLKKITYPTGGSTEFTYEYNKCVMITAPTTVVNGPGLRISQIKSSDGNSNSPPRFKTYKYGMNESGTGWIDMLPDISNMASELQIAYLGGTAWSPPKQGTYRERTFYSGFIPELGEIAMRPVIYPEVAEYDGTIQNNNGKTIYKYDYLRWVATSMMGLFGATIPKQHISIYDYLNTPVLVEKGIYKWQVGAFHKIQNTKYVYSVSSENVDGLHVQRLISITQTGTGVATPPGGTPVSVCAEKFAAWSNVNDPTQSPTRIYAAKPYHIPIGSRNLILTNDTLFDDNGGVLVINISNQYNNRQFLSQTSTISSDGVTKETHLKYPFDYPANSLLTQMVGLNMLDFPIEQTQNRGGTSTRNILINYKNWGTTPARIAPETIEEQLGSNPYEVRLRYSVYDSKGNVLNVAKESDVQHAYIWSYQSALPVAEVINAAQNDIAYTSFESDGTGNWNNYTGIISKTSPVIGAPTGKQFYTLSTSAPLSKAGLTTSTTYTLSYWTQNSSAFSVAGTVSGFPIKGKTINGWTYFEHKITGQSTITLSGSGLIDEVRLYPFAAQMTTYTYDPLIGMTSNCDLNNKITYYEYDVFGRIMLIRDQDKIILKKFCYNYAGQTAGCKIYYNDLKSGSYPRSNCTGCKEGSRVTYTVPANIYMSSISLDDANQRAQDDVNANGQHYADSIGTCNTPTNGGINSANTTTASVYLSFQNVCTGSTYNYTLNPSTSLSLGPIPFGTYNVYMSSTGHHTFTINGYTQSSNTYVNFYNIIINGGSLYIAN